MQILTFCLVPGTQIQLKENSTVVLFFKVFFQVLNCIGEYLAQETKEEKGQGADGKTNSPLSLAHVATKETQLYHTQKPCA